MAPDLSEPEDTDMPTMGGRIYPERPKLNNGKGRGVTKPPIKKHRKRR